VAFKIVAMFAEADLTEGDDDEDEVMDDSSATEMEEDEEEEEEVELVGAVVNDRNTDDDDDDDDNDWRLREMGDTILFADRPQNDHPTVLGGGPPWRRFTPAAVDKIRLPGVIVVQRAFDAAATAVLRAIRSSVTKNHTGAGEEEDAQHLSSPAGPEESWLKIVIIDHPKRPWRICAWPPCSTSWRLAMAAALRLVLLLPLPAAKRQ
jgi:hypothetical protein